MGRVLDIFAPLVELDDACVLLAVGDADEVDEPLRIGATLV